MLLLPVRSCRLWDFPGGQMGAEHAVPRPPTGLLAAGRAVWTAILDDLDDLDGDWELDARELLVLAAAARQADTNAALERAIKKSGVMVAGSKGQPRMNQMVTELRQGRIALEKLLSSLALPSDQSGGAMTAAEKRGQAAANARWARAHTRRRERRGAA
jgi:hypothetical protein